MRTLAKRMLGIAGLEVHRTRRGRDAERVLEYLHGGRIPWSPGYTEYSRQELLETLANDACMAAFRRGGPLPAGYGRGLDERSVEYPWFLARMDRAPARRLDAGSTLNHDFLVCRPEFRACEWTFATLAPEAECHWTRGISYAFCDLRDLPFQDGRFDEVACLSTLEHVGMDNQLYGSTPAAPPDAAGDYLAALGELRRVLRPGGRLLLSVPFGRYENWGWFQQFDADMLDRVIERFEPAAADAICFCYGAAGWRAVPRRECADVGYSRYAAGLSGGVPHGTADPQGPAAAGAVACLVLTK